MSSSLCLSSKSLIGAEVARIGGISWGCARACRADSSWIDAYDAWTAAGRHGDMSYLERYAEVRRDPRMLLPGARTVISIAFPYRPAGGYHHPLIADYALGVDYHEAVRLRLMRLAEYIAENFGAQSRPCVDTAPLPERYWALRAGTGLQGLSGQLIVPGAGTGVFLGELVTTLELPPDRPLEGDCGRCGACVRACPGGAIGADGSFDARRCLSYLTIEYREPLPPGTLDGKVVYGCDICQRVCPHNRCEPPEPLPEFYPDPRLLVLDREAMLSLTKADWRKLVRHSAMKRVKLEKIKENLRFNKI